MVAYYTVPCFFHFLTLCLKIVEHRCFYPLVHELSILLYFLSFRQPVLVNVNKVLNYSLLLAYRIEYLMCNIMWYFTFLSEREHGHGFIL